MPVQNVSEVSQVPYRCLVMDYHWHYTTLPKTRIMSLGNKELVLVVVA